MEKIIIDDTVIQYEHNIYSLIKKSENSIKPVDKNNVPCRNFTKPETTTLPKVYLIASTENEILYIGKTERYISNRLRDGLTSNVNSGYCGYKWKHEKSVKMDCITIPQCSPIDLETIEAEFVFNYRNITGKWPLFQNEIHFHNNKNLKLLAEILFSKLLEKRHFV